MKEIGAIIKAELGDAANRVPSRSIPNLVLRVVALFNDEVRPFVPDLGYAKKTSNEKARRLLNWTPRDAREAIVAAAQSMVRKSLLKT
jgi:nucleoside-diphosphate-sugar epimerase